MNVAFQCVSSWWKLENPKAPWGATISQRQLKPRFAMLDAMSPFGQLRQALLTCVSGCMRNVPILHRPTRHLTEFTSSSQKKPSKGDLCARNSFRLVSDDWCTIVIEIWFTSICCSPYYSVTKNLHPSDNWHTFRQVIFEVPCSNSPLLSTLRNGHGVLNKVAWRGMDLGLYLERWSEAQYRINCRWLKPPKKIKRSYSIYILW